MSDFNVFDIGAPTPQQAEKWHAEVEALRSRAQVHLAPGTEAHALVRDVLAYNQRQPSYQPFETDFALVAWREGRLSALRDLLVVGESTPASEADERHVG